VRINSDDTYLDQAQRLCHGDGPFSGELETTDADGRRLELANYHLGIEHGLQQEWYPSGQLKDEGVSKMGTAVGDWRSWYPDGKLARHIVFDDNGAQIARKRWDQDGNLIEDKRFDR
jgi:antitoxin component YwqK of YwqJK toxin-antitoxin module